MSNNARVEELNEIVRASEQFQKAEAANRILKIPTGDGMALVFYKSPEGPAQCAFEISRALKDNQRLQVRMGIHSGPVSGVVDMNERTNVAGAGRARGSRHSWMTTTLADGMDRVFQIPTAFSAGFMKDPRNAT